MAIGGHTVKELKAKLTQKEFRIWTAKLQKDKQEKWTSNTKLDYNFATLFQYVLLLTREVEFSNLIALRSNKKLSPVPPIKKLLLKFAYTAEVDKNKKPKKNKIKSKSIWYSIFGLTENGSRDNKRTNSSN